MTAAFSRKSRDSLAASAPGPLSRAIAYTCVFSLFGFVQVLTVMAYIVWYINAGFVGDVYSVALVQLLIALAGVAIGILIASVARDYLQAFSVFIPVVVLQMLFGGLMVPIPRFPEYVQYFSGILPYTYASDAVKNIVLRGFTLGDVWADCVALIIIALSAMALSWVGLMRSKKAVALVAEEQPAA
jgi:ABC-2 type transport system permease protein